MSQNSNAKRHEYHHIHLDGTASFCQQGRATQPVQVLDTSSSQTGDAQLGRCQDAQAAQADNAQQAHSSQQAQTQNVQAAFDAFGLSQAQLTRRFHQTIPGYQPTELVELKDLAAQLGVAAVWVKDESSRFGLNAFKGLGGSFALASILAKEADISADKMDFSAIAKSGIAKGRTFATATDGNHGRGLAWAAHELGARAVVYMPAGSASERVRNIEAQGATVIVTDVCYDETSRIARQDAQTNGWFLVQDSSWPGYEEIPTLVMQGYLTLASEMADQLEAAGQVPTHVFLQAGVGSMAGAVAAYLAQRFADQSKAGENGPAQGSAEKDQVDVTRASERAKAHASERAKARTSEQTKVTNAALRCCAGQSNGRQSVRFVIVEPLEAGCLFASALANDGDPHSVNDSLQSCMAGLCCGETCGIAWDLLKNLDCSYVKMPDEAAELGMRMLAKPVGTDKAIVSGESGAAGAGLLFSALTNPDLAWLKHELALDEDSCVLLISTEGDTDKENYRRVVSNE